jgi:hypothetical protein
VTVQADLHLLAAQLVHIDQRCPVELHPPPVAVIGRSDPVTLRVTRKGYGCDLLPANRQLRGVPVLSLPRVAHPKVLIQRDLSSHSPTERVGVAAPSVRREGGVNDRARAVQSRVVFSIKPLAGALERFVYRILEGSQC